MLTVIIPKCAITDLAALVLTRFFHSGTLIFGAEATVELGPMRPPNVAHGVSL